MLAVVPGFDGGVGRRPVHLEGRTHMTDDRRPPHRPARRATIAAAAAAGVLLLGGIAVASAEGSDPSVTDTTLDTSTTAAPTTETTATDTTEVTDTTETTDPTVAEAPDTTETTDEGTTDATAEDEGTHPDNHGKDVSEAAHDHSHDAEAGNHGAYVSGVARGDSTTDTTAPDAAGTSTRGHGRKGH